MPPSCGTKTIEGKSFGNSHLACAAISQMGAHYDVSIDMEWNSLHYRLLSFEIQVGFRFCSAVHSTKADPRRIPEVFSVGFGRAIQTTNALWAIRDGSCPLWRQFAEDWSGDGFALRLPRKTAGLRVGARRSNVFIDSPCFRRDPGSCYCPLPSNHVDMYSGFSYSSACVVKFSG